MIWLIIIWLLKIATAYSEPTPIKSRETRLLVATLIHPLVWMTFAFLWNTWGRYQIGWPEITNAKELLFAIVLF